MEGEGQEELYKLQRLHKAIANEGMQHKTFFTCSFNVFYAFCHFIIEFAVGVPQAEIPPPCSLLPAGYQVQHELLPASLPVLVRL